jgi:Sugar (and other) transporter
LFYQATIGACGLALSSEVASLPLRATTQGLVGLTQIGLGWAVGFTTPYMISPASGNLGGKIGYVFFGLGFFVTIALYLWCPETRGLNYDEVCCGPIDLTVDRLFVLHQDESKEIPGDNQEVSCGASPQRI